MKRLILFLPVFAAFALMGPACSSKGESDLSEEDDDAGSDHNGKSDAAASPDTRGSTPDLQLLPRAVFSGYDGSHTFRAPIAVYGAGADVKVTASDPSVVDIAPTALKNPGEDQGKWFMLTMKKAGTTDLTASSGGGTSVVTLTVNEYAANRYADGEKRYVNGNTQGTEPPCLQCHGGQSGIDHSPAALASAEDPAVETVITTGTTIAGTPINSTPPHLWTPNATELAGLVTYLRALAPRNF